MNAQSAAVSPELITLVRTLVRVVGQRALVESLALIQSADLTVPQLAALSIIRHEGPHTLTALSERLGMSLSHTSYLTEQLVKRGLLSRVEDCHNRRQKIIAVTAAGAALSEELIQVRLNGIEATLAQVPPELRQQLEALLTDVVIYLQPSIPA